MADVIHHPAHYVKDRKFEPIEVSEDWELCHHKACALKYISRAGRKDSELQDLQKAVWYLNRKIALLENVKEKP